MATGRPRKGVAFTRVAIALAMGKSFETATQVAARWEGTPEVGRYLKAAVGFATTGDATWGGPLIAYQSIAGEFDALVRPRTILGNLKGVQARPFNVFTPVANTAAIASWVGESRPIPVGSLGLSTMYLPSAKAGVVVGFTDELMREWVGGAEEFVQESLEGSVALFLDQQLVDPTVAGLAGVSPASITYGVTPITSTGATAVAFCNDLRTAFRAINAAGIELTNPTILMSVKLALGLALLQSSGGFAFPELGATGGFIAGIPVIVSNAIHDTSSGSTVVVFDAGELRVADDGTSGIASSEAASLQMRSDPVTGAAQMVSMFQTNSMAVRITRTINWAMARPGAVQLITGIAL